jgi:hypothetical protein
VLASRFVDNDIIQIGGMSCIVLFRFIIFQLLICVLRTLPMILSLTLRSRCGSEERQRRRVWAGQDRLQEGRLAGHVRPADQGVRGVEARGAPLQEVRDA